MPSPDLSLSPALLSGNTPPLAWWTLAPGLSRFEAPGGSAYIAYQLSDGVAVTVGEPIGGLEFPVPNGELYFVDADGDRNDILFGYRAGKDTVGSRIKAVKPENASAFLIDDLRDDDDNILIFVREWKSTAEPTPPAVYKFDVNDGSKKKLFVSPLRLTSGFLADHDGNGGHA